MYHSSQYIAPALCTASTHLYVEAYAGVIVTGGSTKLQTPRKGAEWLQ